MTAVEGPRISTLVAGFLFGLMLYVINNPTSIYGWIRRTSRLYPFGAPGIRDDGRPDYKALVAGSYRTRWAGVALTLGVIPATDVKPVWAAFAYGAAVCLICMIAGVRLHRRLAHAEIVKLRAHLVAEARRKASRNRDPMEQ